MRPDEWMNTNAYRWTEAASLRVAYQSGYEDARHEKNTMDNLMALEPTA
jgi:hypothetical protein